VVEFLRVNERVAFGLSVAHIVSLIAIGAGLGMLSVAQAIRPTAPRQT
jgi:hypothetical protein